MGADDVIVNLGISTRSFATDILQIEKTIKHLNTALTELHSTTTTWNKKGEITTQTVKTMTDAYRSLLEVFKKNKEGEMELASKRLVFNHFKELADKTREAKQAMKELNAEMERLKREHAMRTRPGEAIDRAQVEALRTERRRQEAEDRQRKADYYARQRIAANADAADNARKLAEQRRFQAEYKKLQDEFDREEQRRANQRIKAARDVMRQQARDEREWRRIEVEGIKQQKRLDSTSSPGGFFDAFKASMAGRYRVTSAVHHAEESGGHAGAIFAGTVAASLAISAISAVARGLREATREALEFNKEIYQIRSISQQSQLSLNEWESGLTKLSSAFGRSRQEVAEGTYEILSNQIAKGADSFNFMNEALKLSLVTGTDARTTVNSLSSAINAYGLSARETAGISASLYKAVDLGRFRLQDLGNTIGRTTFTAAGLGISFNEVLAGLTVLTRGGIPAHEAMTLVNNVMLQMMKPSKEMKSLFEEWGVSTGQQAINAFTLGGVLEKLSIAINGNAAEVAALFPEMRAMRGTFGLAADGAKAFKKDLDELNSSGETFAKILNDIQNSASQIVAQDTQKIKNFFSSIADEGVNLYAAASRKVFGGPDNSDFIKQLKDAAIDESRNKVISDLREIVQIKLKSSAEERALYLEKHREEIEETKAQTDALQQQLKSRTDIFRDISRAQAAEISKLLKSADPRLQENRARADDAAAFARKQKFLSEFKISEAQMTGIPYQSSGVTAIQQQLLYLYRDLGFDNKQSRIDQLGASAKHSLSVGNIEGYKTDLKEIDKIYNEIYETNLKGAAEAFAAGDQNKLREFADALLKVNGQIKANIKAEREQEDIIAAQNLKKVEQLEIEHQQTNAVIAQINNAEKRLFALRPGKDSRTLFDETASTIFSNAEMLDPKVAQSMLGTIAELRQQFEVQSTIQEMFDKQDESNLRLSEAIDELSKAIRESGFGDVTKLGEAFENAGGLPANVGITDLNNVDNAANEDVAAYRADRKARFAQMHAELREYENMTYGYLPTMMRGILYGVRTLQGRGGQQSLNEFDSIQKAKIRRRYMSDAELKDAYGEDYDLEGRYPASIGGTGKGGAGGFDPAAFGGGGSLADTGLSGLGGWATMPSFTSGMIEPITPPRYSAVSYPKYGVGQSDFNPNVGRGYVPRPRGDAFDSGRIGAGIGVVNIKVDGSGSPQATAEKVFTELQRFANRTGSKISR